MPKYKSESGRVFETLEEAQLDNLKYMQSYTLPTKKTPLKLSLIPTNNRVNIIDNYSPNYNYIVEGNKVYYSLKGRDYWMDISENKDALKNLLLFIHDRYNFKGYQDGEDALYNTVFKVPTLKTKLPVNKPVSKMPLMLNFQNPYQKVILQGTLKILNPTIKVPYRVPEHVLARKLTKAFGIPAAYVPSITGTSFIDALKLKVKHPGDMGAIWNMAMDGNVGGAFSTLFNGLKRKYQKSHGDEVASTLNLPELLQLNSRYSIVQPSYTGDTISLNRRLYILPESINLKDVRLGARNRGDYTPLNSEAALVTAFHPFVKMSRVDRTTGSFVGIDPLGRLKIGDASMFGPNDMVSRTYANDFTSFKYDLNHNIVYKRDGAHGNASRSVPIMLTPDGKEGSLNILTDIKQNGDKYHHVAGGRVILKVGNELRLISGSIEDISKVFEDMKKKHKVSYGTFYTLDNGSYNMGLRMKDRRFTALDLKNYDRQNTGGGNFLYMLPQQNVFPSDTASTPNIRTRNSESYKAGHSLKNELKGVVLHHTAFMEDDLTPVTNHFLNPKSEASAHVVIGFDGRRRIFGRPDQVTFHAGRSVWNNRANVNDFMIGIEFLGDTNKRELTDALVLSAVEYLKPIIRQNNIRLEDIVTHLLVRFMYNDYAMKQGIGTAAPKPDISLNSYKKVIEALKDLLYYRN